MRKTKIVELLNTLFHINDTRIARFNNAQNETAEPGLKNLISGFIRTSTDCQAALSNEAHTLGATLDEASKTTARISHSRVNVEEKSSPVGQGEWIQAFGKEEFSRLESYRRNLRNNLDHITSEMHALITQQYNLLSNDLDKVMAIQPLEEKISAR